MEERKSSSIKRRRRKSEEASERAFFSPFPPPQPLFRFTLCFVFLLLLFPQNKTMSSLKLQRRLAASVLGVGKRALWLDLQVFFFSLALCSGPASSGGGCVMMIDAALLPPLPAASPRNLPRTIGRVEDSVIKAESGREKQRSGRRWGIAKSFIIERRRRRRPIDRLPSTKSHPPFGLLPRPRPPFAWSASSFSGLCFCSRVLLWEQIRDQGTGAGRGGGGREGGVVAPLSSLASLIKR